MKEALSNVDVAAMAAELSASLVGARLEKAYQPAKDEILLRLRRKGAGRMDLIFQLGRYLTITKVPPENPDKPSMVAQILRKELGNGRITGVSQIGFDRLLRIDVGRGDGDKALILELFGEGNMLLVDATGSIMFPMRGAEHGARRLKKGEMYQPPPGSAEPFGMDAATFAAALRAGKRDVVRALALDFGFGPLWAEELCLRADIDKGLEAAEADAGAADAIHAAVQALGQDLAVGNTTPGIVYDEGEMADAVPMRMERYPGPRFQFEESQSFIEAVDLFFRGEASDEPDDPRQTRFDEAVGKVRRQVDQMEGAIAGFHDDEAAWKVRGEVLYLRFQEVQTVLDSLTEARKTRSWNEIAGRIRAAREAGDEAAALVIELRPHDATAKLALTDLEGQAHEIDVDVRRSVQENADACYAAAKKARSRAEGAEKALKEARARLAEIEAKGLDGFGAAQKKAVREQRHYWFESYRWTVLPDGFVAVGGRSAGQNDAVVKKYLRPGDRYVHAQIHGAPSVVVRPPEGPPEEPSDEVLRLAGQFAVASSRAWRQFAQASAYWVTAEQVSKTPRSGEFVPKGAWIIHGRRNQLEHLAMEWATGLVGFDAAGRPVPPDEGRTVKLVGGPPAAVSAYATSVIRVVPGDVDPNDAAQILTERFDVTIEEAQAALPGGPVRFEEGA